MVLVSLWIHTMLIIMLKIIVSALFPAVASAWVLMENHRPLTSEAPLALTTLSPWSIPSNLPRKRTRTSIIRRGPSSSKDSYPGMVHGSILFAAITNGVVLLVGNRGSMQQVNDERAAPNVVGSVDQSRTSALAAMEDPLIRSVLLSCLSNNTNVDGTASTAETTNDNAVGILLEAAVGLTVWRRVLLKGRLPVEEDFATSSSSSSSGSNTTCWPRDPVLFSAICQAMAELQLPRLVERHAAPAIIASVLLTVVRMVLEFHQRLQQQEQEPELDNDTNEDDDDEVEDYDYDYNYEMWNEDDSQTLQQLYQEQILSKEELALEIATGFIDQYGGVMQGVFALDHLFGAGHGLLDFSSTSSTLDDNNSSSFGLNDGVWQHSAWQLIPQLQRQVSSMVELRDLLKVLGRRPSADESRQKQQYHRFPPRKEMPQGSLGAMMDPMAKSEIQGLALSNQLSEMLPSEAILLRGNNPALRRLFMAKRVEGKLQSYQLAGWLDVPSTSRPRARFRPRLPSAPGGPLIICLDTSWSMSGRREFLAKAVVLASVATAHQQRRDCRVVAFSNANTVLDAGPLVATPQGVQRLLEFLSHSFGGGTDVTGALRYAMINFLSETASASSRTTSRSKMVDAKKSNETDDGDLMTAADLLLITDGEIPDPPISEAMMQDLKRLQQFTGLEIHGLLVGGKRECIPLSKICTATHTFLLDYDYDDTIGAAMRMRSRTATAATSTMGTESSKRESACFPSRRLQSTRRREVVPEYGWSTIRQRRASAWNNVNSLRLWAKRNWNDEEGERQGKRAKRQRDRDDGSSGPSTMGVSLEDDAVFTSSDYSSRVEAAVDTLREAANAKVEQNAWQVSSLDNEKNAKGSCWQYRDQLKTAIERISENLVERDEESRLVVLGMVCNEHVLLLGEPGTGKSELGRRLSKICGGLFFQRLLTRFTTPDEIFGPLSLQALENDEYRRCTQGFLPTASIAFLDEIFKANSAILNTLLTILNEREFDNGSSSAKRESCPIRCVVGASNELPESEELDALYDRFLLRKEVLPVSDEGIMKILRMPTPGATSCDSRNSTSSSDCELLFTDGLDQVVQSLAMAANYVEMGDDACALMRDLRTFMREDLDTTVSDRRLIKAARLLKLSAASHGRTRVDPIDCLLLQHVAWRHPEQRSAVKEWLWDHLTPGGSGVDVASDNDQPRSGLASQSQLLLDNLCREVLMVVRKTGGDVTGASGARENDVEMIRQLRNEIDQIAVLLQQRASLLERHIELLNRSTDHLWLHPDESKAIQQLLLPKAQRTLRDVHLVLANAHALEMSLHDDGSNTDNQSLSSLSLSPSNDLRLSVIEQLAEENDLNAIRFTEDELSMDMRDAKQKYDLETFRAWKRASKKAQQR